MVDTEGIMLNCTLVGEEVICNGTKYVLPEVPLSYKDMWFWIYLGIYAGLVLFAGLMSGLTLGMLSLDMMTLKVLQEAGTEKEKKYAGRILPVVKRHHLLLVTLLLANAVAVESMPLCLDRVSDPITAIVVSVTAVLLFGEVFPQALCSRFGLAIGATMVPVVYLLMGLFFVIAWPLSKLLDCMLGSEHATFFRRAELKALVGLHGPDEEQPAAHPATDEGPLSIDEVLIIKGALELRDKTAADAMVPLDSVFMIDVNDKMDHTTMKKALQVSHSRVPVYKGHNGNIVGVLLIKMLIMLDPDDAEPVNKLIHNPLFSRQATYIDEHKPLYDILNEFQTGKSHMAFVTRRCEGTLKEEPDMDYSTNKPPGNAVVGIITLEDIIEELLQEEIIDETDVYVDVTKRVRVARARASRFSRSNSTITTPAITPSLTPTRSTSLSNRKDKGPQRSISQTSNTNLDSTSEQRPSDSTPLLSDE